jgi:hypothetical protein
MTLLNASDKAETATIRAGLLTPGKASRTSLSGEVIETLAVSNGEVKATVGARAWTRIVVA